MNNLTKTFQCPQGELQLGRQPLIEHPSLQAWDAADTLLLNEVADQVSPSANIWVYNDTCGALTVALAGNTPLSINDSVLSQQACLNNLELNGLAKDAALLVNPLQVADLPAAALSVTTSQPDWVLIKLPKVLSLLEQQLAQLRPQLKPETKVIAGGMVKHMSKSAIELFEQYIGPTHTSLAQKKARLIFSSLDADLQPPSPKTTKGYKLDNGTEVKGLAGVFARDKLDIGSRLLLEHLPTNPAFNNIVDLGCGNGVLGIAAAQLNPEAKLNFIDESYMAVASAELNFRDAFGPARGAEFKVSNALTEQAADSVDLILNNPPFHQLQVQGDDMAWLMFKQAKAALKVGGQLWVVGNRHLGYHTKLKHLFGNCTTVASNRKFVVLKAERNA